MSFVTATEPMHHRLELEADFEVYRCACDFCKELTPLPTPEQLDSAIVNHRVNGCSSLAPCIAKTFGQAALEEGYKPFGRSFLYRPEGWLLVGERWVCPKCMKKVTSVLEGK